jgi:hypothetical protein
MPPLPPGATSRPSERGTQLASPPRVPVHQRIAPEVPAPTVECIDERVKRLERTMQEFSSLLPLNLPLVQPEVLEDNRGSVPSPVSPGQTLPLYQITSPNETPTLTRTTAPRENAGSFESQISSVPGYDINNQETDVLALHSNLTLIQAEILEELFSTKARQRSADLSESIFRRMFAKLEIWGRSSPFANTDASKVETLLGRSGFIHAIMLEALLFETSYQLHAAKALCGFAHHLDLFSPDNLRTSARMLWPEIYLDAQRVLKIAASIMEVPMVFTWLAW